MNGTLLLLARRNARPEEGLCEIDSQDYSSYLSGRQERAAHKLNEHATGSGEEIKIQNVNTHRSAKMRLEFCSNLKDEEVRKLNIIRGPTHVCRSRADSGDADEKRQKERSPALSRQS